MRASERTGSGKPLHPRPSRLCERRLLPESPTPAVPQPEVGDPAASPSATERGPPRVSRRSGEAATSQLVPEPVSKSGGRPWPSARAPRPGDRPAPRRHRPPAAATATAAARPTSLRRHSGHAQLAGSAPARAASPPAWTVNPLTGPAHVLEHRRPATPTRSPARRWLSQRRFRWPLEAARGLRGTTRPNATTLNATGPFCPSTHVPQRKSGF